jgi:hypothetical protein
VFKLSFLLKFSSLFHPHCLIHCYWVKVECCIKTFIVCMSAKPHSLTVLFQNYISFQIVVLTEIVFLVSSRLSYSLLLSLKLIVALLKTFIVCMSANPYSLTVTPWPKNGFCSAVTLWIWNQFSSIQLFIQKGIMSTGAVQETCLFRTDYFSS